MFGLWHGHLEVWRGWSLESVHGAAERASFEFEDATVSGFDEDAASGKIRNWPARVSKSLWDRTR